MSSPVRAWDQFCCLREGKALFVLKDADVDESLHHSFFLLLRGEKHISVFQLHLRQKQVGTKCCVWCTSSFIWVEYLCTLDNFHHSTKSRSDQWAPNRKQTHFCVTLTQLSCQGASQLLRAGSSATSPKVTKSFLLLPQQWRRCAL